MNPRPHLTDEARAANRAAAQRDAAKAPRRLHDWQVQILAPLLGPTRARNRRRRDAA